jgi:hypothetical protein
MLAALLPLIEALGAEGGAAGVFAGGAEGGGIGSMLGRLVGGTKAFGSEAELGGALRKISDLNASIEAAQQAIEAKRQQQAQVAHQAREDERQYAFSDPAHQRQMLELNRQQQEHRADVQRQQRELNDLRARAAVTSDPAAARASSMREMGATVGLIGAASAIFPQPKIGPDKLSPMDAINPVKMMQRMWQRLKEGGENLGQAGANVGGFVAGDVNSGIAREGVSSLMQILGDLRKMKPTAVIKDVSELPAKIVRWSDTLVESQRHLGRFNGTIAMMNADTERRTVLRQIASGQRTGGATADLNTSLQNLYDQLQPMKDSVTVVIAKGLTVGVDMLSKILKTIESFKPLIDQVTMRVLGMNEKQYKEYLESFERVRLGELRKAGGPIRQAFERSARRDRTQRLGVPRR